MKPQRLEPWPGLRSAAERRLHHLPGGRFYNPWMGRRSTGFSDLLRWEFLSRNRYATQKRHPPRFKIVRPDLAALEAADRDYAVWLGHSTIYLRLGRARLIVDPIFGRIAGVWTRHTPLPLDPLKLPGLDAVLISHNHHDHLDLGALRLLSGRFDPLIVAGLGHERLLARAGLRRLATLDWWEALEINDATVRALPVQHWSMRLGHLPERMLWCGFAIAAPRTRLAFLGDSGHFAEIEEIGAELGPFDAALLPIGAYEPRWFMSEQHMDPAQALDAALRLRARRLVPVHWGTFDLSDEPLDLPPAELRRKYEELCAADPAIAAKLELVLLEHGGTLQF